MNVLLQRHCARYIYVVPEGLKELMSDISREVIRSDPENIYTFIADYLDALLITRENARVAARLVQSITDIATTTVEFLLKTGMDRPEADNVVNIIQKTFRKCIQTSYSSAETESDEVEEINIVSDIIDEADIPPEIGEEAAKIIQNAYRKFKIRRDKERELLSGMVDWRVAARSAIRLYRKTGVTYEEANRAATLIKAAYKGYYTRRVMRKLAEESKLLSDQIDEEEFGEEEIYDEHDQKFVTINYGSITPHVDFDESKMAEQESTETSVSTPPEPQVESTASTVVFAVTEEMLNLTLEEIQKKELQLISAEDNEETVQAEEEKASEEKKVSLKDAEEETEAQLPEESPQSQEKDEEVTKDHETTEDEKHKVHIAEEDNTEYPAVSEAKTKKSIEPLRKKFLKPKGMVGLRMQHH